MEELSSKRSAEFLDALDRPEGIASELLGIVTSVPLGSSGAAELSVTISSVSNTSLTLLYSLLVPSLVVSVLLGSVLRNSENV